MNLFLKIALCLMAIPEFPGPITTAPADNLLAGRKYCGYQHTDDYDRTNHHIAIDEYPWMAQLQYGENKRTACSGSLINNRYVLTAGHCLFSDYANLTGVRLGDYNVTTEMDCTSTSRFGEDCSAPVEDFEAEELIRHPSFDARSLANDIGLIRLSKLVHYSDYIRPICLPQQDNIELSVGQRLATSGWGLEEFGGQPTDIKKRVFATVVADTECKKLSLRRPITDRQICVQEYDSFTCQGDSGAPLMHSIKNQWEQVGLVSFGSACGFGLPSVYARVTSYLKWIHENIRE